MKNPVVLCLAILALSGCAAQNSPPNLGEVKKDVRQYVAAGGYDRDVTALMQKAEAHIVARADSVPNPAVILDIDETSLSNLPLLEANDFTFLLDGPCDHLPKGPCGIKAWQKTEKAKAFPATLHLFETAQAHNVTVFFITGRDETVRKATEANLRRAGYHDWKKLIMRPAKTATPSASNFKAPQRQKIEEMGFHIIANIGDQPSDLAEGHADKTFLVPNPFYRLP